MMIGAASPASGVQASSVGGVKSPIVSPCKGPRQWPPSSPAGARQAGAARCLWSSTAGSDGTPSALQRLGSAEQATSTGRLPRPTRCNPLDSPSSSVAIYSSYARSPIRPGAAAHVSRGLLFASSAQHASNTTTTTTSGGVEEQDAPALALAAPPPGPGFSAELVQLLADGSSSDVMSGLTSAGLPLPSPPVLRRDDIEQVLSALQATQADAAASASPLHAMSASLHALNSLYAGLHRGTLQPATLLARGVLPLVAEQIGASHLVSGIALEVLCSLLSSRTVDAHAHELPALVPRIASLLRGMALPGMALPGMALSPRGSGSGSSGHGPWLGPKGDSTTTRHVEVGQQAGEGRALSLAFRPPAVDPALGSLDVEASNSSSRERDGSSLLDGGSAAPALHGPFDSSPTSAAGSEWTDEVGAAFFACSALVRLARFPDCVEAMMSVDGGGVLPVLLRLIGAAPKMIGQISTFALYKLVRPGPCQAAALHSLAKAGGVPVLCRAMQCLEERTSRDMAASILLDAALVAPVPATVARLDHVLHLVRVLAAPRDEVVRMYALLVLARLANHCPAVQMDAVREGALPPLLLLVTGGCEEEQTHACRLLAILAQAVPTHGLFREHMVVPTILQLLAKDGLSATIAEHAASVLSLLAQNPDTHFHMVGCGAVPALMPYLAAGTNKAKTYTLATMLMLADADARHAAVIARAGAIPHLLEAMDPRTHYTALLAAFGLALPGEHTSPPASPPSSPQHSAAAAPAAASDASGTGSDITSGPAAVQEFAAATLCSLARYLDIQAMLMDASAVPRLLRTAASCTQAASTIAPISWDGVEAMPSSPSSSTDSEVPAGDAPAHAAEALLQLACVEAHRQRLLARPELMGVVRSLLVSARPGSRYWGIHLLKALSADDTALQHMLLCPGMVPAIAQILAWHNDDVPAWQLRRAKVQAAWVVTRLAEEPRAAAVLLASPLARTLVSMLRDGEHEGSARPGGAVEGEQAVDPHTQAQAAGALRQEGGGGSGGGAALPQAWPGSGNIGGLHGSRSPLAVPLDYNLVAAATGALLGLARLQAPEQAAGAHVLHGAPVPGGVVLDGRTQVMAELGFQEWCGWSVRLEGLFARSPP